MCESKIANVETDFLACPPSKDCFIKVHSGWSSCSGAATSTGLYVLRACCRRLQINHAPRSDSPIIRVTNIAKMTIRYSWCHHFLPHRNSKTERNCNPSIAKEQRGEKCNRVLVKWEAAVTYRFAFGTTFHLTNLYVEKLPGSCISWSESLAIILCRWNKITTNIATNILYYKRLKFLRN